MFRLSNDLSIHDLLAEVDEELDIETLSRFIFQFTTSSRRSTSAVLPAVTALNLSIHDLLAEVDRT